MQAQARPTFEWKGGARLYFHTRNFDPWSRCVRACVRICVHWRACLLSVGVRVGIAFMQVCAHLFVCAAQAFVCERKRVQGHMHQKKVSAFWVYMCVSPSSWLMQLFACS